MNDIPSNQLDKWTTIEAERFRNPVLRLFHTELEAVYEIPNGRLLEGTLPSNKEKLVQAWIEIHKEDLMANCELAVTGNKVFMIDPLK